MDIIVRLAMMMTMTTMVTMERERGRDSEKGGRGMEREREEEEKERKIDKRRVTSVDDLPLKNFSSNSAFVISISTVLSTCF